MLATLAAALLLSGATASATAVGAAETRVGAHNLTVEVLVEPQEHIGAGQRLGVLTREVGDAAGGWSSSECGVCPVMVVDV